MACESFGFEAFPRYRLDVASIVDCQQTSALLALVRKKELDVVLLDGCIVPGVFPLRNAAYRALHALLIGGKLSASSLHSEIVYALQGGRNVGEALRLLGPKDDSTMLVLARVVDAGAGAAAAGPGAVGSAGTEAGPAVPVGVDRVPPSQWAARLAATAQGRLVAPSEFLCEAESSSGSGAASSSASSAGTAGARGQAEAAAQTSLAPALPYLDLPRALAAYKLTREDLGGAMGGGHGAVPSGSTSTSTSTSLGGSSASSSGSRASGSLTEPPGAPSQTTPARIDRRIPAALAAAVVARTALQESGGWS